MSKVNFFDSLLQETNRLDNAAVSKRNEKVILGFTDDISPKAIIDGKEYRVFNSNDYLGLRHTPHLKNAEHQASSIYGTGPGAVRFISGTLKVHKDLEKALAKFHGRDDAIVFSSAFAANLGVIFSLLKGQSKDSKINENVLLISDELNHRSIIDGIRLAQLPKEQRQVMRHLDFDHLDQILTESTGKFSRVVFITDGVFSMLGEYQKLDQINQIIEKHDSNFDQGILFLVDDCHGVGACGKTGRGTEEVLNTKADVLIGTLGKAFGADGGYVVANQMVIDYLREASATYIYSNTISPGTAGAALAAIELVDSKIGVDLLQTLEGNIWMFKNALSETKLKLAVDSRHPIQPVLIGDSKKTAQMTQDLFEIGILATKINYPVVPQGRDEIRIQISAAHTQEDIEIVVESLDKVGKV